MRKLILFNLMTLDGFFADSNRALDWHVVDEEFRSFASQQLDSVDTILFGRLTYQLMAAYWPSQAAIDSDPIIARQMNQTPKIVFFQNARQRRLGKFKTGKGERRGRGRAAETATGEGHDPLRQRQPRRLIGAAQSHRRIPDYAQSGRPRRRPSSFSGRHAQTPHEAPEHKSLQFGQRPSRLSTQIVRVLAPLLFRAISSVSAPLPGLLQLLEALRLQPHPS